jgi:PAS domain S-box-containing protein
VASVRGGPWRIEATGERRVVAAAAGAVAMGWVLACLGGPAALAFNDFQELAGAGGGALALGFASRRIASPTGRMLAALGVSLGGAFVGMIAWDLSHLTWAGLAVVGDVVFVLSSCLGSLVTVRAIFRDLRRDKLVGVALDTLILSLAAIEVVAAIWGNSSPGLRDRAAGLGAVVLVGATGACAFALVARRIAPFPGGPWGMLTGSAVLGASWLMWLADPSAPSTVGPSDILFSAGMLLIAYGGTTWATDPSESPAFERLARMLTSNLPVAAILSSLVVAAAIHGPQMFDLVGLSMAAVIVASAARQLHLHARAANAREAERRANRLLAAEIRERDRLAAAVEQAAEAIVLAEPDGRITYVNPAFTQVTGYAAADVVGCESSTVGVGVPQSGHDGDVATALARGGAWSGMLTYRRADGSQVELDSVVSPMRDHSGAIVGTVTVGRDITRERLLEIQLGMARRLEVVGRLAGGIAHDFNNILTAIRGFGELATSETGSPKQLAGDLAEILRAADRASSLTQQLLAFSGRQVMQPQLLDVGEVVVELAPMLQRLIREDIHLVTPPMTAGPALVDRAQLEQVIVNLVINARDAMPDGGRLTVVASNVDLAADDTRADLHGSSGSCVQLIVSDTGSGMAREVLEHSFEPFFTTKAPGKGTGLGLSTVFGIVQQSRGWVHIWSEPGRGTTVGVYLPRLAGSVEERAVPALPAEAPRGCETILVVEDEPAVRGLAERVLTHAGYRVFVAESGEAALEVVGEATGVGAGVGAVDLLFSDVVMPGMSGRELAERLTASRPQTRVILASGYSDEVLAHPGTVGGRFAYLAKPYTGGQLLRLVRATLDGRATAEAEAPPSPEPGTAAQ